RFAATPQEARELRQVLDRLRYGIVFLREDGAPLEANAFAARLFEQRDGLTVAHGQLVATHRASDAALTGVVRAAMATRRGGEAAGSEAGYVERGKGARPLSELGLPMPRNGYLFDVRRSAVALLVTDPDDEAAVSIERLRRRFRLTASEARRASELMRGLKLRDAADRAGLTYETARWYLKSTFQKTGATRQADLVRLLLSDPGLLIPE